MMPSSAANRPASRKLPKGSRLILIAFLVISLAYPALLPVATRAQSSASTTWAVSIILPPKIIAGRMATLAVLGVDGRLAEGITVTIGDGLRLKTDKTGRASFTAPSGSSVIIASGSGNSAAALVDAAQSSAENRALMMPPVVSLIDQFSICGGHFVDQADSNLVNINGERAFVLAASPECLVVLASPRALPGAAKISVENSLGKREASTTLVSLHFDPPMPPLVLGKKSALTLHVQGSDQQLRILVENRTPRVLRFLRGDTAAVPTSGGVENSGTISIEAITTGDFSFRARILPVPDYAAARRYLLASEPLAPKEWKSRIKDYSHDLERHPRESAKMSHDLQVMAAVTVAGDFKTLLEAARTALQ